MKTHSLLRIGIICAVTCSCMIVGCVTVTTHNHFPEQPASNASATTVAQTAGGAQCQCGAGCVHHDGRYSYYPYPPQADQGELARGGAYPPSVIYAPPGYGRYPNGYYPPTVIYSPPVYRDRYYPPVIVDPESDETADVQPGSSTSHERRAEGSVTSHRRRSSRTDDQELPRATDDQPPVSDREYDGRPTDITPADRWDHQPAIVYPITSDHPAEVLPATRRDDPPYVDAQSGNDQADENTQDQSHSGRDTRPIDAIPVVTGPLSSSGGSAPRRTTQPDTERPGTVMTRSGDRTISPAAQTHGNVPVRSSRRSEEEGVSSSRNNTSGTTVPNASSTSHRTEPVATLPVDAHSDARRLDRQPPQVVPSRPATTTVTSTPPATTSSPVSSSQSGSVTGTSHRRTAPASTATGTVTPVAVEARSTAPKTTPSETVLVSSGNNSAGTDVQENSEVVKKAATPATEEGGAATSHSRRAQPR